MLLALSGVKIFFIYQTVFKDNNKRQRTANAIYPPATGGSTEHNAAEGEQHFSPRGRETLARHPEVYIYRNLDTVGYIYLLHFIWISRVSATSIFLIPGKSREQPHLTFFRINFLKLLFFHIGHTADTL